MSRRLRSTALIGLSLLVLTSGCARMREHRGYMMDETLATAIQPGVDNRASVEATLGRPTFVGQFDQRDWYYVSRDTKQLAFAMPKPTETTVLHVQFDERGNVAKVERGGLDKVVSIDPDNDRTPTLGRERGFLRELFGNIGSVGAGGMNVPTQ